MGPKYDWMRVFENGISIVKLNELVGAINTKGNELLTPSLKNMNDIKINDFKS